MSKFLHDDASVDDVKTIAIPWVFSENSRVEKEEIMKKKKKIPVYLKFISIFYVTISRTVTFLSKLHVLVKIFTVNNSKFSTV